MPANMRVCRAQVRYGQLLRDQERMMTEMERAVDRRGTIALRAESADRRGRKKGVNFFQRQKKIEDLRRRFKHARRVRDEQRAGEWTLPWTCGVTELYVSSWYGFW